MTITTIPSAGVGALNGANANQVADALRLMGFGSFVRAMPIPLRNLDPNTAPANPYALSASYQSIKLPDDAKAASILRAYARTGTGTAGELTPEATAGSPYTAPGSGGEIGVSPSGDLLFHAADAYTNVDVVYQPEKYDVKELILTVSSSVLTIPSALVTQGVVFLMEAQALAGTTVGTEFIQVPSNSAPSTGQACLNLAKSEVLFATADAVTQARVKLGVANALDLNAFLETAQALFP
jgi:hypothetical protein